MAFRQLATRVHLHFGLGFIVFRKRSHRIQAFRSQLLRRARLQMPDDLFDRSSRVAILGT